MATAYVRAANPIWYLPDLEGLPLNDEYYIFFLTNVFPYVPQPVFHDVNGTIPWNNPLEFYPNGTLPDNLYFNDSQVYRLEVRHGNSQTDPLIYEINDFVPGSGGGSTPVSDAGFTDNQASNGQFSQISFTGTYTISVAGTYEIAPGWFLALAGAGTTVLTQQVLVADQDQINDPPYALSINNTGWSSADLYQRFNHNGAIWSSNNAQDGFISMSVTTRAIGSSYDPLSLIYKSSDNIEQIVATGPINTGSYQVLSGTIKLPLSVNSQSNLVGYVDAIIRLKGTGQIYVTNVQIVGQALPVGTETPASPVYKQETIERGIDHLFHYYRDSIIFQPKATILTGWNFPLNPFQFITQTVTTNVAQTKYICDQTILHQEAASQIASGVATNPDRFGLKVQAVSSAATTKFAVINYMDTTTTYPYWSYKLSALVKLRFNSTQSTAVRFKMLLMYRTIGAPPAISASEPIAGWSANEISLATGWTAIKPINDPIYTISHSAAGADQNFVFNGFQLPASSTDTMYLAAVFYTVDNMNSTPGNEDYFVIDKISLVNNDFAIDTQPQTFDDVMRQCQYYYEKSYDYLTLGGAVTNVGAQNRLMNSTEGDGNSWATSWDIQYSSVKRAIPTTLIYAPGGTVANVQVLAYQGGNLITSANAVIATFWNLGPSSTKTLNYLANVGAAGPLANVASVSNISTSILYQYTANALLGAPTGIP